MPLSQQMLDYLNGSRDQREQAVEAVANEIDTASPAKLQELRNELGYYLSAKTAQDSREGRGALIRHAAWECVSGCAAMLLNQVIANITGQEPVMRNSSAIFLGVLAYLVLRAPTIHHNINATPNLQGSIMAAKNLQQICSERLAEMQPAAAHAFH